MHLVGLYTYCRMMHGAYNVKLIDGMSINFDSARVIYLVDIFFQLIPGVYFNQTLIAPTTLLRGGARLAIMGMA